MTSLKSTSQQSVHQTSDAAIEGRLSSMTGFGRAEGSHDGAHWAWELRSVNGKALDLRLRLPSGLEALEATCRELAAKRLARGNVTIGLTLQKMQMDLVPQVNEAALNALLSALDAVRRRVPDAAPVALETILAQRGVVEWKEPQEDADARHAFIAALTASFEAALESLVTMRQAEGTAIGDILRRQVHEVDRLRQAAEDAPSRSPDAIRERMRGQVEALMETGAPLDPARLHQEAALLATRADIREELDRLAAHVQAANVLLDGGGPVGRRLDFLAQEFNRETNTLCAKANGTDLTAIGLELKAVIDQMREQIQNLE